jgi:hypothetical protein
MKLLEKINRHEVLRRWAVGEVYSEFYNPVNDYNRSTTLSKLISGNFSSEQEGINTVLEFKQGLVDSISQHINWYRALLEINKSDLDLIYTLQLPGWKRNTEGSYLISDAARNIRALPRLDSRVTAIYRAYKQQTVKLDGITLLAVDKIGPYVAVEGTGRLTGIYIAQYFDQLEMLPDNHIEVSLGLY